MSYNLFDGWMVQYHPPGKPRECELWPLVADNYEEACRKFEAAQNMKMEYRVYYNNEEVTQ